MLRGKQVVIEGTLGFLQALPDMQVGPGSTVSSQYVFLSASIGGCG
jgi:hypothetical protein